MTEFTDGLAASLKWVKEPTITQFLAETDHPDSAFVKNLILLGRLSPKDLPGKGEIWGNLLAQGKLDTKWFADPIAYSDGFPLCDPSKGTFAQALLDKAVLPYHQLSVLLQRESTERRRLEELIAEDGGAPQHLIYGELARFLSLPYREEISLSLAPDDLLDFPLDYLEKMTILPERTDAKTLWVSSPKPVAILAKAALSNLFGKEIVVQICPPRAFEAGKIRYLALREEAHKQRSKNPIKGLGTKSASASKALKLQAESTVEMVAALVERAVESRATDIHLEPRRDGMAIRYRVDGFLYEVADVDVRTGREILSRIKILADMDITERRLPQDGHFRFSTGSTEFDMRLATVPTNFGERMEIRLAEGGKVFTRMEDLGLDLSEVKLVNSFITKPHGIILATGPVGSGKTTTLYSSISGIDAKTMNVMTIEDPIEYIIPGANQIEVNYRLEFDFVNGLRAILRQDPNVILVGEIRDEQTARIAIRAGMTGMLVFSTLHANDAVGAVTTLSNFQINRFLIANALVGSIAQRLVRRICPHCARPVKTDSGIRDALKLTAKELSGFKSMKGEGCENCFYTGYKGRTGIFEIFSVSSGARLLIMQGATEEEIRQHAVKEGLRSLRDSGFQKIKQGITTVEEYIRVLG